MDNILNKKESGWKNLNDSNNIHVSHYTPYYEDDNLIAYQLELY